MKKYLGLLICSATLATIGLSTISSIDAHADSSKSNVVNPKAFSIFTIGNMSSSGDIVNNGKMTIDSNGKTKGILTLKYDAKQVINFNILDQTDFYMKIPDEFRDLVTGSNNFLSYVDGTYDFYNGGTKHHVYTPDEMSIQGNGSELVFKNPKYSSAVGQKCTVTININLGKAVTESGIRIPDANTTYYFNGVTSLDRSIIDWSVLGNDNAGTSLSMPNIDPGYNFEKNTPKINDVYDTDKTISGTGAPGAKIAVYGKDGKSLIGSTVVRPDGTYIANIEATYLPLIENDVIYVTQNTGIGESNKETAFVQHGSGTTPIPGNTQNDFKTGYWSDDQTFLAIEGKLTDNRFDFGKQGNTQFTFNLKNDKNVKVYSVASTATDFYTPGVFNGYQTLIPSSIFGNALELPVGSYKASITATNSGISTEVDLNTTPNFKIDLKHEWTEIQSKAVYGRQISFATVGGHGVITIQNLPK